MGTLHYPLADALAAPGQLLQVAPGVYWVRMSLPFELDHINVWLLRDEIQGQPGWTIVDCCVDQPVARQQWEHIFEHALEGLPVLRVIVTHMHPDHIGLAHWLCERWNVLLWMSAPDYVAARLGTLGQDSFGGHSAVSFFKQHGMSDPHTLQQVQERSHYYLSMVPHVPSQYQRLFDAMPVRIGQHTWHCMSGYGHAPEHIALHCPELGVFIGGDMMLPRISTNISVYAIEPEGDPLRLFLQSLSKMEALPENTLCLPSHGKPFTGMHTRIQELRTHHEQRLQEVWQACREQPKTAMQMVPVVFKRELNNHQITFALTETIAHLHTLWYQGRVHRTLDADGVYRFRAMG